MLDDPPPAHLPIQRVDVVDSSRQSRVPTRSVLFLRSDMRKDGRYHYQPFFSDFGPPDLGAIFRFCEEIDEMLKIAGQTGERVVHCVSNKQHARSNGALLMAAYALIRLNRNPLQAYAPLMGIYPPLSPFRDASYGLSTYNLSVLDCLKGIHRAMSAGIWNPLRFNADSYMHYAKVENGDWNWIEVDKLLAFSGPRDMRRSCQPRNKCPLVKVSVQEYLERQKMSKMRKEHMSLSNKDKQHATMLSAQDYTELLCKHGVTDIVRLNESSSYDCNTFLNAGFNHHDMQFSDGAPPSFAILERFLEVMVSSSGAVAVHCKAGLGRTGTLAAAYIMRYHDFTAREAIAWVRIMRPGSIVGPQQHFLVQLEAQVKRKRLDERAREDLKKGVLENQRKRMQRQAKAFAEHQAIQNRKVGLGGLMDATEALNHGSANNKFSLAQTHGSFGSVGNPRPSQSRGASLQVGALIHKKSGARMGRLREYVPIVGPTPGSVSMLSSRPRTTLSSVRKKTKSTKHIPGLISRRRDRDVNGMCRGRPQIFSNWQQTRIVKHDAHSHGSRGGPRPEPDAIPGVTRRY